MHVFGIVCTMMTLAFVLFCVLGAVLSFDQVGFPVLFGVKLHNVPEILIQYA